ncbi:MAG: GNAT family N-acetyltransferase [Bacteroidota bacterium]
MIEFFVRNAKENEFLTIGELMVKVYSQLEGFPNEKEQVEYYDKLRNIGEILKIDGAELLVAVSSENKIAGAVVYFNDLKQYGPGGIASNETDSSGFRLLAVDSEFRGKGIAKILIDECLNKAKANKHKQVIIHSTKSMQIAWKMYKKLGFKRSEDLDFMQGKLAVFGFRLKI